ncbi:hypothetical protein WDU94_003094 [Cyamophila willieti]
MKSFTSFLISIAIGLLVLDFFHSPGVTAKEDCAKKPDCSLCTSPQTCHPNEQPPRCAGSMLSRTWTKTLGVCQWW